MPDIRVIDTEFNPKAFLDNCTSISFSRALWEIGAFEIHINMKKTGAGELQPGRIAFLDERRAGIILFSEITESKKGAEISAIGMDLKGIVGWRMTVPGQKEDTAYFGYDRFPALNDPDAPAESVIKHYIDNHMVNPDDPNRKFPGLVIAPDQQRGPAMRWQSRWEPLDAVLKGIGEFCGMGYEIRLDLKNKQFVFDIIPKVDKTTSSENPVIFAASWGNADKTKYSKDERQWRNAGYAGGAGEDEGRLIQTVFENDVITSGWGRREAWLDCGNIEYVDDLLYEGKHKLQDKRRSETLTGNVIPAGPFVYLRDWDLGNRVTVQSAAADSEVDMQITGANEAYERGKENIVPVFGTRIKTILDEIRKIGVVR